MSRKRLARRKQQRTGILRCARGLFAERGFDDVTVAEVAAAAGVARATVFNHFGSKHGLVEALAEAVLRFHAAMLENALADHETSTPVLVHALFDRMGRGIEEDRRFYRGVFREMAKLQFGFEEGGLGNSAERTQGLLVELLARGQQRGDLRREHDPVALASAFTILASGTITVWLYGDSGDSLCDRMGAAAGVFLAPVQSSPAPIASPLPDLSPREECKP